ncbi:MAG: HD domain-containing protein [Desulfohalobiaceae bacterium]|nr:HD domain-containing protein [Desulfohalobiaceae bacterium]
MISKNSFISQFQEGQKVEDLFVLAEARLAESKNGPYWNLKLQDRTGKIEAKIWHPQSSQYTALAPAQLFLVQGVVRTFRGQPQLTVSQMRVFEDPDLQIDWAEFIPSSSRPPEEIMEELEKLCREELTYKPWLKLSRSILKDPDIRPRLLAAPAAKSIHHAYRGGLLEHSLNVTRLCLLISSLYQDLDREILLVAACFHDLGKAWELGAGISHEYTDPGRLLGHIQLGLEVLEPFLQKTKDLDPGLIMHFKHLLLSHHGEYAFGSPKRPKTPEAFVLHYADNLDAKIKVWDQAVSGLDRTETNWTTYFPFLERQLYHPPRTDDFIQKGQTPKPGAKKQCLLPLKE